MSFLSIDVPAKIADWPFGRHYDLFMDPKVPILTGAVYFVTVHYINHIEGRKAVFNGPIFKALVVLHNVFLAVFSALTFLNAAPHVFNFFYQGGFSKAAYCDAKSELWNPFLHYWSWLFYLSKYYEILDTVIILLQGKKTSLLQSFHHAGAILSMFWCTASQTTAVWIFVCFNSFIHTIMYTYYTASTFGFRFPFKSLITYSQITQFLVGDPLAISYLLIPGCIKHDSPDLPWYRNERWSDTYTIVYVAALVVLFADFAKKSYSKKGAKANGANGHANGAALKKE
ncbi:ELO family [Hyaloraphidium curvatum]|nr:ELO family [Hyaloraphidium curvatum]